MRRPSQSTVADGVGGLIACLVKPRDRTHRLVLDVCYSGGAESWWLVRCRGREWRFPGHLQLEDVMAALCGERPYRSRSISLATVAGRSVWLTSADGPKCGPADGVEES